MCRGISLFFTSEIFRRHYPIFFSEQYWQCAGKNIGAAGGAVKKVVSTITSGVGTLIGGAAKAIGGMISMFASLFGW